MESKFNYGYIGFAFTKKSWTDWCIAKVSGSKWSHSFITTPPILNHEIAMEAAINGVTMVQFDIAYRNNPTQIYEIYEFVNPTEIINFSISDSMKTLQTFYGFLEFPWFMWRYINQLFGRDIKGRDNWCTNGVICSELVRNYMIGCGLGYMLEEFGDGSVSPEDIYKVVKTNPEIFRLRETRE